MSEIIDKPRYNENLQVHLQQVQRLLAQRALKLAVMPPSKASRREPVAADLSDLDQKLATLHPTDIAYILEALPIGQRLQVWELARARHGGEILISVSGAVRESLIAALNFDELREAAEQLDIGRIADLAPVLPQEVMREVFKSLPFKQREQLRATMASPADAVGALMDFGMVTIREDVTLKTASRYLRRRGDLPECTDQLFVVDRDDIFKGVLPLKLLLLKNPDTEVAALTITDTLTLLPDDKAEHAVRAFERYSLTSAPVVDEDGKLLGRITMNTAMDYIRSGAESTVQSIAGLRKQEDIFAPAWKSAQNRWLWLALNLCAVFVASRVIGSFAHAIEKMVALAALMPIVAGIAANAAIQAAAVVAHAPGQASPAHARQLAGKELAVAGLNGLAWGGVAGLFAYALYKSVALALVVTGSMVLSLMLAALAGVLLPLALRRMGKEQSMGSGILLSAVANSGGFLIFLGLATIFLPH